MTEYEQEQFCEECNSMQDVITSGSGNKWMCQKGHLTITITKMGKSFKRIEDTWED
jgi:hypothetical protein|tara:strand:+ start:1970 stop:2137 length:168 start_codon:yes stop_codon:yes gene_type:complete